MNSVTNNNIFLGILFKFVISFEQISCNAVELNHAHQSHVILEFIPKNIFSLMLSKKETFKFEAFPLFRFSYEKNSTLIDNFNCYVAIHSFENV